jgi:hypothetical protein
VFEGYQADFALAPFLLLVLAFVVFPSPHGKIRNIARWKQLKPKFSNLLKLIQCPVGLLCNLKETLHCYLLQQAQFSHQVLHIINS